MTNLLRLRECVSRDIEIDNVVISGHTFEDYRRYRKGNKIVTEVKCSHCGYVSTDYTKINSNEVTVCLT